MKLTILLATVALLCGCSTINSLSSTVGIVENAAIQAGTDELIIKKGGPTTAGELALAQKIKAIAVEIEGIDSGTVTVAQLQATLAADIAKLTPAEQVLANALLEEVTVQLGVKVQQGLLSTAANAIVLSALQSVVTACQSFGA
jgi:hypothetical protein